MSLTVPGVTDCGRESADAITAVKICVRQPFAAASCAFRMPDVHWPPLQLQWVPPMTSCTVSHSNWPKCCRWLVRADVQGPSWLSFLSELAGRCSRRWYKRCCRRCHRRCYTPSPTSLMRVWWHQVKFKINWVVPKHAMVFDMVGAMAACHQNLLRGGTMSPHARAAHVALLLLALNVCRACTPTRTGSSIGPMWVSPSNLQPAIAYVSGRQHVSCMASVGIDNQTNMQKVASWFESSTNCQTQYAVTALRVQIWTNFTSWQLCHVRLEN